MNIKKISNNHFVFADENDSHPCSGEGSSMMRGIVDSMQQSAHAEDTSDLATGGSTPMDPGADNAT